MTKRIAFTLITSLATIGAATHANAQSSVTLFGVVDAAIAYQTHVNAAGKSAVSLNPGGEPFLSASRFGFMGTEDLGGGTKAKFVLESGFQLNTGKLDQQGQLFGRQAYLALSGDWGELEMGRQYNGATWAVGVVDPFGIAAAVPTAWVLNLIGQRNDNTVAYLKKFGPVGVNLRYSFGQVAGSMKQRATWAGGLTYEQSSLLATAELQQVNDSQSRSNKIWTAGAKYGIKALTLYAYYVGSVRQAGFDATNGGTDYASITNISTPALPSTAAAYNSVFGVSRRDQYGTIAASYDFTPTFTLTGVLSYGDTSAVNFSGARKTAYFVADYKLSKRTDVYFASAYERVSGGWSGLFGNGTTNWTGGSGVRLNGSNNQMSVFAGLRHKF